MNEMKKKYAFILLFLLILGVIVYYSVYLCQNNGSVELELVSNMEYHNENIKFRPTRVISRKVDLYLFLYEISRCYHPDSSGKNIYILARERLESDRTSDMQIYFTF